MARRKKNSRRRSKVFHINAIETGAALSLIQSTNAAAAVASALGGDVTGAANKPKIVGTLAATAVAKMLTRGFKPRLAKLGPIAISL